MEDTDHYLPKDGWMLVPTRDWDRKLFKYVKIEECDDVQEQASAHEDLYEER